MTTMVESLLQLELGPAEGDTQGEMFTSVHLRPVYISTASPPSPHTNGKETHLIRRIGICPSFDSK